MGAIFGLVGAAASAAGTIAGGSAAAQASEAQAQMSVFKAKQEWQEAGEARAASQRSAMEHRREGDLVQSALVARAAAQGGSATDPGVLAIGEEIAGRSEYSALMERYKGENRARGHYDQKMLYERQADSLMAQAKGQKTGAMLSGIGTLIGGAGSAYKNFSGVSDPYAALKGYG